MSEAKILPPAKGCEESGKMFITPLDLNITFAEYFRLKFEAVNRGMLMSQYVKQMLQDEECIGNLDPEVLELMRKLSSFVDDIDYYIVWGGDGFWRIRSKTRK